MSVTTDERRQCLDRIRLAFHARCVACGSTNGRAPRLRFVPTAQGGVAASFQPNAADEGYNGILHGGVIATLLDAAMTNCLFAHGHCGATADLHVRYRHPVTSAEVCTLWAWIERSSPPLFVLRAELRQTDQLRATATAKFMVRKAVIS
jgi:acyl-coenzyme A thioesterase PaaI-like protein